MRTGAIIRHVLFEDLGTFAGPLREAHYDVRYYDIGHGILPEPLAPDLMVILGAPVGVYDGDKYPFLRAEAELLAARLKAARPTLGICLGAQLIAHALGAKVYPSGVKEIGFGPLDLRQAAKASPLKHLANTPVLHWHGDTFDLPPNSTHLAATPLCRNQAFSLGSNILALQFHAEFDSTAGIEPWLIGHAAELAAAGIDPRGLREAAKVAGSSLADKARQMIAEWLQDLRL